MAGEKFKEGDLVYHKAMQKRGVIVEPASENSPGMWVIVWEDSERRFAHKETELWTVEEYEQATGLSGK